MLGEMLMDKRILLPNVGNACRCLFGPVDHDEVKKTLHRELKVIQERNSARWNFDFTEEKPLPGRWDWDTVEKFSVPKAYDMPQLSAKLDVRVCKMELKVAEQGEEEGPAVVLPTPVSEDTTEAAQLVTASSSTQTSPKKRKRQAVMTDFYPSIKKARTSESKHTQP